MRCLIFYETKANPEKVGCNSTDVGIVNLTNEKKKLVNNYLLGTRILGAKL
ncbi:MAG: hypothetical protein ACJAZF_005099 [Granulosicoccus sp.]|jgi:hypothetical protein